MISRPAGKVLLTLLLALSLFFKIRGRVSQEEVAASGTAGRIAAFLKRNGFETDEGASDEEHVPGVSYRT
jgi:hypothetical protein